MGKKELEFASTSKHNIDGYKCFYIRMLCQIYYFFKSNTLKINYTNLVFIIPVFTFFKKLILQYKVFEVNLIIIIKYNNKN